MPVKELSLPLLTVNGKPLCHVTSEFSIQPLRIVFTIALPWICGSCRTFENLRLCGTSSRDSPQSK